MYRRTIEDYHRAFATQYDALRHSSANFDVGNFWESVRIANAIYMLLGPSGKNHTNLVERLNKHSSLQMPTSVDSIAGSPLVICQICVIENKDGNSAVYQLSLRNRGRSGFCSSKIGIAQWWAERVIMTDDCLLDRLTLVRVIRDKDGGAHYDETISDPNYVAAATRGVAFRYSKPDGTDKAVPFYLEQSMRQLADEVLEGLGTIRALIDWLAEKKARPCS